MQYKTFYSNKKQITVGYFWKIPKAHFQEF